MRVVLIMSGIFAFAPIGFVDAGNSNLVGEGASASEISAFIESLAALPEANPHDDDGGMADEHMAALGLVERNKATHVAIKSGDWSDPSVWSNSQVPGDSARVLIPAGATVHYGIVSDARLFTVRVDGKLEFATDNQSQMVFDTLVVSPSGMLEVGSISDPVDANVNIDLIVANNGPIDTIWDPQLLSRGIILHGETSIHGAVKDSHAKVAEDPMTGDASIKLSVVPDGWRSGDTIVIAGTNYDGYSWDNSLKRKRLFQPEDEVRVITAIDRDGRVYLDEPLEYDHDTPRMDLKTSVANYTRNVSVQTENADSAKVYERGHVMFMHTDDVDVRYAEFFELGRTDKSVRSRPVGDFDSASHDSNVQGRYSLHLHRAGVGGSDDPAMLIGNAVYGSPGWGYTHHDSHAVLENNASYGTFGAGFVAETGNETGVWKDNIAIFAQGVSWGLPKNSSEIVGNFDTARGGDGFWFQGRLVQAMDNVAASVNHGYVYFHRDKTGTMKEFHAQLFDFPEALFNDDRVRADDVPIREFDGNETFAANEGIHVVKANPKQGHDIWSHLRDFRAWNVKTGAHLQYTSHYILENFDVVGKETRNFSKAKTGILFGGNTSEMVVLNASIENFETGINLFKKFTNPKKFSPEQHAYIIVGTKIMNVEREYANYDRRLDTIIDSHHAPLRKSSLELDRMVYDDGPDHSQRVVLIEGTKYDSLGSVKFPNGMDIFRLRRSDVVRLIRENGYWKTPSGEAFFMIKIYFTDRFTGELFFETYPIYLASDAWLKRKKSLVLNGVATP